MTEDRKTPSKTEEEKLNEAYLEDIQKFKEENLLSEARQRKIMKRGKWRARFVTALHAIGIFLLLSFVTSMLTFFYYSSQSPIPIKQGEKLQRVIDYTHMITDPYGFLGTTTLEEGRYFTLKVIRDHVRMTGNQRTKSGQTEVNFFFSFMGSPKKREFVNRDRPAFLTAKDEGSASQWEQLEKLPEGTVATAYVTLSENLSAEEIVELLSEKDLRLLWLALELDSLNSYTQPVGVPIIFHKDFSDDDTSEQTEGYERQFLQIVKYLNKHEKKANKLTNGDLSYKQILADIEKDGFNYYGLVVTGPTKEILSFREESWLQYLSLDGVELWSWD